jgi:hypothetical protein
MEFSAMGDENGWRLVGRHEKSDPNGFAGVRMKAFPPAEKVALL